MSEIISEWVIVKAMAFKSESKPCDEGQMHASDDVVSKTERLSLTSSARGLSSNPPAHLQMDEFPKMNCTVKELALDLALLIVRNGK